MNMNLILNTKYYEKLLNKYTSIKTLSDKKSNKFTSLVIKIILDNFNKRNSIHFNFQNENTYLNEVAKMLFIETANDIYCTAAELPDPKVGDKIKARNPRFKKNSVLKYLRKVENKYELQYENNDKSLISVDEDTFIKDFIPISQNVQDRILKRFIKYFKDLNEEELYFFSPTNFSKKSVFVAPKSFYDSLEIKNKIPTTYFPNSREENIKHELKSIPALPDSIMYFTPKYSLCYENIFLKNLNIDTLVLLNPVDSDIEQVVQDKNTYKFNLIILTNSFSPKKQSQIPCWNWYKEEIDIINSL